MLQNSNTRIVIDKLINSTGLVLKYIEKSTITPIYKVGNPSEISNYRPISLIFEKIIFKQIEK